MDFLTSDVIRAGPGASGGGGTGVEGGVGLGVRLTLSVREASWMVRLVPVSGLDGGDDLIVGAVPGMAAGWILACWLGRIVVAFAVAFAMV